MLAYAFILIGLVTLVLGAELLVVELLDWRTPGEFRH